MNSDILEIAKENHNKTIKKFIEAGGRFLFYDANSIDSEKFKPIVIAESEIELKKK